MAARARQKPDAGEVLRRGYRSRAMELFRRLAVLPEPAMRAAGLSEQLAQVGPVQAVWILETLVRGALRKLDEPATVYLALLDPDTLAGNVSDELLDSMLQVGVDEGCIAAVQWLRSGSLVEEEGGHEVSVGQLIDPELKEVALGVRRSMARRANGDMLDRLLLDPDPVVITNLLHNPRTTEATVLKICSRRPTVSPALEAVLQHPRWRKRYRVKLALLRNPYLRLRYAVNLLVLLNSKDLKDVSRDEKLAPMLRLAAQRLMEIEV